MGFVEAIRVCFQKYFTLSGRASRSEYWWFILFLFLLGIAAVGIDTLILGTDHLDTDDSGPVEIAANLATFVPWITVCVRRLHDTGRPGSYIFIPVAASLIAVLIFAFSSGSTVSLVIAGALVAISYIVMLVWLIQRGTPEENAYGTNPLEPQEEYTEVFR